MVKICNKRARWNICYDNFNQEPDYNKGKGRVVDFNNVPYLNKLIENIKTIIGDKMNDVKCEGNYYYDESKCGIGYHGDTERRKVIGIRLGSSSPIYYQWYKNNNPVGQRIEIPLNKNDIYIMSEKAVGTDWKKKNQYIH